VHNFRKLLVWQRAVDFAVCVYVETKKFPADERIGLSSQLRRAACSISLNIAEGSGNRSSLEFKRFLQIALRSGYEVSTGMMIAYRLAYLS
jgi:four helix bundle protein